MTIGNVNIIILFYEFAIVNHFSLSITKPNFIFGSFGAGAAGITIVFDIILIIILSQTGFFDKIVLFDNTKR